jgi:hypothetical protein
MLIAKSQRTTQITVHLLLLVLASLTLAACSSSPKLFVNQEPNADFSSYSTYNFEANLGTDEKAGYHSILSQYLITATSRELEARGYTQAENPDLSVNFNVLTKEKIRTRSSPSMSGGGYGGYGGYRGYDAYGGYETTVTQYTEGTVNIDLIDTSGSKKQLVWEGIAVGKISDDVLENLEQAAYAVVEDIFSKYPYVAPGYVPPEPKK